jgi:hypothetical protein
MPLLDPVQRESVNQRLALHQELAARFQDRQYTSQHCYWCNWASNGLTLDAAVAANREHEATHPENAENEASEIPLDELVAALHDHECQFADCVCICGCRESAGCILVFGPLCGVCAIRGIRGDSAHAAPEQELEVPDA